MRSLLQHAHCSCTFIINYYQSYQIKFVITSKIWLKIIKHGKIQVEVHASSSTGFRVWKVCWSNDQRSSRGFCRSLALTALLSSEFLSEITIVIWYLLIVDTGVTLVWDQVEWYGAFINLLIFHFICMVMEPTPRFHNSIPQSHLHTHTHTLT